MFHNDLLFGFVAFVFALMINRLFGEKALRRLTAEEKVHLVDSFSPHRTYNLMVLLVLMVAFVVAVQVMPSWKFALSLAFFAVVAIVQVVNTIVAWRKLKKLQLPKSYLNNYLIRCVVYYCGLGVLIVVLMFRYLEP